MRIRPGPELAWLVATLTLLVVYFAHEDIPSNPAMNSKSLDKLWIFNFFTPAFGRFFPSICTVPRLSRLLHLVPDDGLAGITRPLIGKDYELPVIDRSGLKQSLWQYSLATLALLPFLWLIVRRSNYQAHLHGSFHFKRITCT